MSKRLSWSPEDHEEFAGLLDAVFAIPASTERYDAAVGMLLDAEQAHRPWAHDLVQETLRLGMQQLLRRERDRRASVAVSFDGRVVTKPRVQSVKRTDDDGEKVEQQSLIDFWTWEEIEAKAAEYLRAAQGFREGWGMCRRLLQLRDRVPGALTPADACAGLGTTVEAWLSEEVA